MPEKDTIFTSKIKYTGVFSFKDFYKFCYDWLKEETGLDLTETKYAEKIEGAQKKIDVEWTGEKKLTDYFRFDAKVIFKVEKLKETEINQGGAKIKTNDGAVEVSIKGVLVRDYEGKFETTAFKKFLRGIYEKWVIPSRIEEYKDKIATDSDKFLNQAKAYLDLEGKKE
ncbi:MAG: hypothetical protein NTW17_02930 [Candidatus Pacearchaeota archaeon]|nr:hypothetical protein [Candidatus Pacearchaeota archaeon]